MNNIEADMDMVIIFTYTSAHYDMPHWKCVLRCCDKCPNMVITNQEANRDTKNTCPTIRSHVYINVSRCTVHGRCPYK